MVSAAHKNPGMACCAMPGIYGFLELGRPASGGFPATRAGAIAFAVAFLLACSLATAIAWSLAGTAAVAAALAFVHVSLAIADISAGAARLATAPGAGSLRERESCGDQQAGGEDENRFRFHGVSWFCVLWGTGWARPLQWMKLPIHEQPARDWITGLSLSMSKAVQKSRGFNGFSLRR